MCLGTYQDRDRTLERTRRSSIWEKIKELVTETTPEWAEAATELVEVLRGGNAAERIITKIKCQTLERLILEYGDPV